MAGLTQFWLFRAVRQSGQGHVSGAKPGDLSIWHPVCSDLGHGPPPPPPVPAPFGAQISCRFYPRASASSPAPHLRRFQQRFLGQFQRWFLGRDEKRFEKEASQVDDGRGGVGRNRRFQRKT